MDEKKHPHASPTSGVVPPEHSRFKPGQSGNPAGRPPNVGSSVTEWANTFAKNNLTRKQLRTIATSTSESAVRIAAALRLLRMTEIGDVADFAGLLRGENNLEDLREMGIATDVIKKYKQTTRKVRNAKKEIEELVTREIELHDRSGEDFDRVCDRTDGKPTQRVEHDGEIQHTLVNDGPIRCKPKPSSN